MVTKVAIPLPSALLLVESHTPNATQAQDNALNVTQQLIRIALKQRLLVHKNAPSRPLRNAITRLENAQNAKELETVVSQPLHAKTLAQLDQTHMNHGCATGIPQQENHNANKTNLVP